MATREAYHDTGPEPAHFPRGPSRDRTGDRWIKRASVELTQVRVFKGRFATCGPRGLVQIGPHKGASDGPTRRIDQARPDLLRQVQARAEMGAQGGGRRARSGAR